jgi:hypothetical protein
VPGRKAPTREGLETDGGERGGLIFAESAPGCCAALAVDSFSGRDVVEFDRPVWREEKVEAGAAEGDAVLTAGEGAGVRIGVASVGGSKEEQGDQAGECRDHARCSKRTAACRTSSGLDSLALNLLVNGSLDGVGQQESHR